MENAYERKNISIKLLHVRVNVRSRHVGDISRLVAAEMRFLRSEERKI
jgi:hypothetical protein